ncbi:MAG: hypothetical protein HYX36_14110 [Rhizobiales bacterium]|nr:hypothetical protein [Hyphomicrobiales bacterium]
MSSTIRILMCLGFFAAAAMAAAAAPKDRSRLAGDEQLLAQQADPAQPAVPMPLPDANGNNAGPTGSDQAPADDGTTPDTGTGNDTSYPNDMSLGEIPEIHTMELTVDIAKRAIDTFGLIKTKYANTDLEQYDKLQDFVDQNAKGKEFEADIKAAGFANVNDWNLAITTLGFAYSGVTNDPTADIKQQIGEIEADTQLAQDMKDRMILSLNAMIPSENNRKVVQELLKDPTYVEKLKQLDTEEE